MITEAKLENIPKYEDFTYWFVPNSTWYDIEVIEEGKIVGTVRRNIIDIAEEESIDRNIVSRDWAVFRGSRPEYLVTDPTPVDLNKMSPDQLQDYYEKLIIGVSLIRAQRNVLDPDSTFPRIAKTLSWIRSTDFFVAPASTIYHESRPHGLLYHTLTVVEKIKELYNVPSFSSVSVADAVFVALVHDWCKIGLYEQYTRNVKNEVTGEWEKVPAYRRKPSWMPLGHGAGSLWLAHRLFKISTSEALAIRWHMGEYNVASNEMDELHRANETEPLVQMLQFADRLSITQY